MSLFGRNRSFVACVLFLIRRFRWSLNMTIQLMKSKYPPSCYGHRRSKIMRKGFEKQLKFWIKELSFYKLGPKTYQFGVPSDPDSKEEVLLMHTYMNTLLNKNGSKIKKSLENGVNSSLIDEPSTNPLTDSKLSNKEVNWADSSDPSVKNSVVSQNLAPKQVESCIPSNLLVTIIEHPGEEKFRRSIEMEKLRSGSKSRKSESSRSRSKKGILKESRVGLSDMDVVESFDVRTQSLASHTSKRKPKKIKQSSPKKKAKKRSKSRLRAKMGSPVKKSRRRTSPTKSKSRKSKVRSGRKSGKK
jgi:hypothetical protein